MLTTAEAAAVLGLTRRQILKLISQDKINAVRFGRVWQVDEESIEAYRKAEHRPGWTRGKKRARNQRADQEG